jgi:hypothetical protein
MYFRAKFISQRSFNSWFNVASNKIRVHEC